MKVLLLYMGILAVSYVVAARSGAGAKWGVPCSKAAQGLVYIIVVLMGMRLGSNRQVTDNLLSIGLQALIITVFCVGGSIAAVAVLNKLLLTGSRSVGSSGRESQHGSAETGSALAILLLVAAGAVIGFLFISGRTYADSFERRSGQAMTLCLCLMQACIGAQLGFSGQMSSYFGELGAKILIIPLAAVTGTLAMGALSGCFLGFSLRESLAISAGFGWYSYAPAIIAGAGEEHMVAGAVAFLHNVIRETAAIVLIPLCARYIGSVEATSMPGVSAMDICMPIIERSCRQETVVYAFFTGLVMHVVTSVGVPIIMSI